MKERPEPTRWRRALATVGPVLLVGLLGIMTLRGLQREDTRTSWVRHTQDVLLLLDAALIDLLNAETGQRGYLITGDSAYLTQYQAAQSNIGTSLQDARELMSDNVSQQEKIDHALQLVQRRLEIARETIRLWQSGDTAAATGLVRTRQGTFLMDSIRVQLTALRQVEENLLATRITEAEQQSRLTAIVVVLGTLLAGGVALLVNVLLANYAAAQESSARKQSEQNETLQLQATELQTMNDRLAEQAIELESQADQLQQNALEVELQRDELQKVSEELQLRTQVAEDANRAKADFLRAMSHELRTPLNAIGGYAQLLELGVRGPLTTAQLQDLSRIMNSQRHLLSLINDILNFAKLEAGRVHFQIRRCPMGEIVDGIEELVRPQIETKGQAFQPAAGGDDLVVDADPEKVRQILLNLLSNAIKFTPEGGHIAMSVGARDDVVFVRVADTGIGIPADRQAAVFEPFVQVHRTLSETTEGTGLGLAISRELARAMGGDLTVESEPGVGSTFTLELRRSPAEVPAN